MSKYKITKEFFLFSLLKPPIMNSNFTGSDVEINETIGTMHGFDIVRKAKITKVAINKRITFMKNVLKKSVVNK